MTTHNSNGNSSYREDAENRFNNSGSKGDRGAHEVLKDGKNHKGEVRQVTVPEGSNLSGKQQRELMLAIESNSRLDRHANSSRTTKNVNDTSLVPKGETAATQRAKNDAIIKKYKAEIHMPRPYAPGKSTNSLGRKWCSFGSRRLQNSNLEGVCHLLSTRLLESQ